MVFWIEKKKPAGRGGCGPNMTQLCLHSLVLWENMGLIYYIYDMIKKPECEQHSNWNVTESTGLGSYDSAKQGSNRLGSLHL